MLFDPQDGKPLKRYFKEKDGTITLFSLEVKFHPQYGTALEVINGDIAQQIKQKQVIKQEPTQAPSASSKEKAVKVSAYDHSVAKAWLNTGIEVSLNDDIVITAKGIWSCGDNCDHDPDGVIKEVYDKVPSIPSSSLYPLPERPFSLIGKIGETGKLFVVGTQYRGKAKSSGILYLGYNDFNYLDNSKSVTAHITVK